MSPLRAVLSALLMAAAPVLAPLPAAAQGFAAYISPPRFEVRTQAGQTLRQVLEIQHVGQQKGNYRIYTNDWVLNADQSATFSNELAPDSCRPWVAIERKELALEPGARYRYRFEITPPAGTAARECRFAIMVEGLDPTRVAGNLNLPVGGRIAVIVYATVGDAAPRLEIVGARVAPVNGQAQPQIAVRNSGNATGRLEGIVRGTDASGAQLDLSPADLPVLPGETRALSLSPGVDEGQPVPTLRFPLVVQGQLASGAQRLPLDLRFAPAP